MLEVLIKRHYREHELHGLHTFVAGGRPFADRRLHPRRPTHPPHVDDRRTSPSSRRAAPSTRPSRPTCGPGPRATTPSSTSTSAGRRSRESPDEASDGSPAPAAGPALRPGRPAGRRRRRAPAGAGPSPTSPSAPARAPSSRTASCAACTRWSAAGSTSGACTAFDVTRLEAPEDVLLYECVARDNPEDRRLVAPGPGAPGRRRARRGRPASRACRTSSAPSPTASRRSAGSAPAAGSRGSKLDMNHVWVQIWPTIEADLGQLTALQTRSPRSPPAPASRRCSSRPTSRPRAGRRLRSRSRAASTTSPAPASSAPSAQPPTEPLKPLDDYASKVVRARRRGLVYPYELQAMIAGDGGTVVEHDLDDTGRARPGRPPLRPQQGRHHRRRRHARRPVRHPAGRHPGRPERRPAPLARLRRRGRVRPGHRGASTSPSSMQVPAGVVLPLGRRAHLDGLRHREHGLGGPRPQAHHRVHPGRAARSTSSSPASTSAPSPTGTPRRRCSCTPRASSS